MHFGTRLRQQFLTRAFILVENGWTWRVWSEHRGGGGEGGDYSIIQITAGNNLVADVFWSTMVTTHQRSTEALANR